jgi:hypothetical protein
MSIYSDEFYINQVGRAYDSAKAYFALVNPIFHPKSIVDVGCGRGAWLKAFRDWYEDNDNSLIKMYGVDGSWNSKEKLLVQTAEYFSADLNNLEELNLNLKVDILISVETAEHINSISTESFIKTLCQMSDVIIFSGAFKDQGGLYHFNERLHSDWASNFSANNFSVYDFFRPSLWGRSDVNYWYQQNVFLYVKNDSPSQRLLSEKGILPLNNIKFLDCVHYEAFLVRSTVTGFLKQMAQKHLPPKLVIFMSNFKIKFFK